MPEIHGPHEAAEIYGPHEAANYCKFSAQRMNVVRREGRFPDPDVELMIGPIWFRATLDHFLRAYDRTPGRRKGD